MIAEVLFLEQSTTMEDYFGYWEWLALAALIAGGVWAFLHPWLIFKIQIVDGVASVAKGRVHDRFVRDLERTLQPLRLSKTWVGATHEGRRVKLVFARNFPADCRQQVRNL